MRRLWTSAAITIILGAAVPVYGQEAPAPAAEPESSVESSDAPEPTAGQPAPEPEAPAAPHEPEALQQPPVPNLNRSSWIVLMAILGEQLPEGAVLERVEFLDSAADARIHVILPKASAATMQAEMMARLQRYFTTVEASPFSGPGTALYLEGDIRLAGVPTLAVYRQRKSAAQAPAPAPPAAQPAPARAPAADPWPRTEVRQVFTHGEDGGMVAQLVLQGNEYIVREGRAFASNQYRFVGMAPASAEAPNSQCIILERIATGDTQTFCVEPQP